MKLPDDVVEFPHQEGGNETRLRYRLNWARSYLKHQGAVENARRGVWTLTSKGRDLTPAEIVEIPRRVRQSGKTVGGKDIERKVSAGEVETDVVVEAVDKELAWTEKLLSVLLSMKPDAFERLCQLILRESGFTKVEVTGKSGDGGIDGYGVLRVKLVSFQVIFQCKRWKDTVGSSVIRDFRGAMVGRADKGLVMTTGRFTPDARKEAIRDGAPAIDLVDGDDLCELLKELKIGVNVRQVEEVTIDKAALVAI